MSKTKTYKESYYNLEEDEIQALIAKSKINDGKSQSQLLEIFNNFLTKYVSLLYYGKYNLSDYDIRRFAALFVKDGNVRFFLLRNKLTPGGYKHVSECVRGVQYMAQRYGDEEDVRQTVQMTFLQCVSRYERKGPIPFSGFLYSYFFFMLKKNVDAFLIDQLGRKTFPLISDDDYGDNDGDEMVQGFHAPAELSAEDLLGPEEIDEYWVIGDTAMPPFDSLSIQERQLLKWRYVDGQRSSEIAQKITEHPNTVREHFNRIRGKVRDIISEDTG